MKYHVRVLTRAQRDVDCILRWLAIERNSPQGAARWLDAFEAASAKLVLNPYSYAPAHENENVNYDLRQFPFKTRRGRTYRGLFTIVDNEIRILRVRGPGQASLQPDELANEDVA